MKIESRHVDLELLEDKFYTSLDLTFYKNEDKIERKHYIFLNKLTNELMVGFYTQSQSIVLGKMGLSANEVIMWEKKLKSIKSIEDFRNLYDEVSGDKVPTWS